MKAQSFRFGMKFRSIELDPTPKIYLTFHLNCGILNTITLADIQSIVA